MRESRVGDDNADIVVLVSIVAGMAFLIVTWAILIILGGTA
jgi:hypothetical protein